MRHFTKSTTFDVSYMFNGSNENQKRNNQKERSFSNEAMFDVKNIVEK